MTSTIGLEYLTGGREPETRPVRLIAATIVLILFAGGMFLGHWRIEAATFRPAPTEIVTQSQAARGGTAFPLGAM